MPGSLAECLSIAVSQRRELGVARRGVQVAQEGRRVANADFAPKIVGEGLYLNFQQGSPQADIGLGVGFIRLEWGLFEGGRRVGELRVADAKIRAAMSLAESVADTISFQITEAYRQMITARSGINRALPAVDQARENHRLVKARAAQGDATAAELTDAETALTRAQQDHMNSIFDYLTALAELEYAMGLSSPPAGWTEVTTASRPAHESQRPVARAVETPDAGRTAAVAGAANLSGVVGPAAPPQLCAPVLR